MGAVGRAILALPSRWAAGGAGRLQSKRKASARQWCHAGAAKPGRAGKPRRARAAPAPPARTQWAAGHNSSALPCRSIRFTPVPWFCMLCWCGGAESGARVWRTRARSPPPNKHRLRIWQCCACSNGAWNGSRHRPRGTRVANAQAQQRLHESHARTNRAAKPAPTRHQATRQQNSSPGARRVLKQCSSDAVRTAARAPIYSSSSSNKLWWRQPHHLAHKLMPSLMASEVSRIQGRAHALHHGAGPRAGRCAPPVDAEQ